MTQGGRRHAVGLKKVTSPRRHASSGPWSPLSHMFARTPVATPRATRLAPPRPAVGASRMCVRLGVWPDVQLTKRTTWSAGRATKSKECVSGIMSNQRGRSCSAPVGPQPSPQLHRQCETAHEEHGVPRRREHAWKRGYWLQKLFFSARTIHSKCTS